MSESCRFLDMSLRTLALVSWLCMTLIPLPAQTQKLPTGKQAGKPIRVTVGLVQTDVMVFDRQGQFVPDLKKEQFELRVDGKVLDVESKPVNNALLTVSTPSKFNPIVLGKFWMGGTWLLPSAKSDIQGNFSILSLPRRDTRMDVRAEGFEPYSETLDTTKDVEKNVYLKRPQIFRVTVMDPETLIQDVIVERGQTSIVSAVLKVK